MIKRSPEQWQFLFDAHTSSGLSAAAFCREHKLCPKYFSLRRKQLTQDTASSPRPDVSAFVPAKIKVPAAQLELSWHDTHLVLPPTVSPQWVADLLKALT